MNSSSITIVSGFPLYTNPRAVKEADALAAAGYDVTVLTACLEHDNTEAQIVESRTWKTVYLVDNRKSGWQTKTRWLLLRTRRKLFNLYYRLTGQGNIRQLGYCTPELIRYCLRHPADHYSLHLESSLAVGVRLAASGHQYSYSIDFGDWYSMDLTGEQLEERPVALLEQLERQAVRHARFTSAASTAMAAAIGSHFQVRQPITLYNCFSITQQGRKESSSGSGNTLQICWFSQTVGPYRGLEPLLQAVARSTVEAEVHLVGKVSLPYRRQLEALFPRTQFHDPVPPDRLVAYISQFDVGYAGEVPVNRNRDLTVTNKVFQYLLAGLPVLASDTAGQKEIAAQAPDAVHLFSDEATFRALLTFFADRANCDKAASEAARVARERFNWETESRKLLEAIADADA